MVTRLLLTFLVTAVTCTRSLNILIASNCFWEEVSPNLAVMEELLVAGHNVAFACPTECVGWVEGYQGVEVLSVEGPGIQDMLAKRDKYTDTFSKKEFLTVEAENYVLNKSCDMYQRILTYLQENKIDVMLATYKATGAIFAAENTDTPLLMNYNSITLSTLTEYCQGCGHGETAPRLQYSGYGKLNLFQEFLVSVAWNMAPMLMSRKDSIINNRRLNIGLSSYYPKSAVLNLHASYPKIYPIAPPLISENVKPHEGRWIVGPLLPKLRDEAASPAVLNFIGPTSQPRVLISFSGLLHLSEMDLRKMSHQLSETKDYITVWSLDQRQREVLTEGLGANTGDELNIEKGSLLLLEEKHGTRELLRHVDLVVMTSTYTNIMEACVEGKPMLLVPTSNDEQTSTELIENLGCGMTLHSTEVTEIISSIKSMVHKLNAFSECNNKVKKMMDRFRGTNQVVDIIERMGERGYQGLDLNYQTSSVPDIVNCWIAIIMILLQTVILTLLGSIIVYNLCYRDWSQEETEKEKID